MNINFNLRDKKTHSTTSVILVCRWNGKVLKFSTGISVKPKEWSVKNQKIFSGVLGSYEMNNHLSKIENSVKDFYYIEKNKANIITKNKLKMFLEKILRNDYDKKLSFKNVFDLYLESISDLLGTYKNFKSLYVHLIKFSEQNKIHLDFSIMDKSFMEKFVNHFIALGHVNETIRDKHLKTFKTFLRYAYNNSYLDNEDFLKYKFPYKVPQADKISLTETELNTLFNMDLSTNKKLERVRDVFCIECYTGIRFSDTKSIKQINLQNDILKIKNQNSKNFANIIYSFNCQFKKID